MDEIRDVLSTSDLIGMQVLSRATGNKVGTVRDLNVDPVNGLLLGLSVDLTESGNGLLSYEDIYSFGRDAIMAEADDSVRPFESDSPVDLPRVREHLIGTKVISDSGQILGQIANVFVTLQPPPFIIYEVRSSILDKLFRREFFILASPGHALSNDAERLVVPEDTWETAASNISDLINQALAVRTFNPAAGVPSRSRDDTWVPAAGEEETVVRHRDEEETVLRQRHADLEK